MTKGRNILVFQGEKKIFIVNFLSEKVENPKRMKLDYFCVLLWKGKGINSYDSIATL